MGAMERTGFPETDASVRTVLVAVAANLLIAVAKGVAATVTGSAAMLAEATHSIADTCNEVLLFVGVRRGMRPADDRHPLGYGQARFFWSLIAAVGIFVVGGLFAINDGVQSLRHPEPVTNVGVGVAGLEGWSWRTARRQLRAEARARHLDLGRHVVTSSDPMPTTVFLEDSAALVGLALALVALLLHAVTGSAMWDGRSKTPTCSRVSVGCVVGCCHCRRSPRSRSRRSSGAAERAGSVAGHSTARLPGSSHRKTPVDRGQRWPLAPTTCWRARAKLEGVRTWADEKEATDDQPRHRVHRPGAVSCGGAVPRDLPLVLGEPATELSAGPDRRPRRRPRLDERYPGAGSAAAGQVGNR